VDPYQTLGVPRTASQKAIEHAFRKKAKQAHPDCGGSAEAFQQVHAAYKLLSDPAHRERFDRTGGFHGSEAGQRPS
jgi:curved DNA-binding protein CbpA